MKSRACLLRSLVLSVSPRGRVLIDGRRVAEKNKERKKKVSWIGEEKVGPLAVSAAIRMK